MTLSETATVVEDAAKAVIAEIEAEVKTGNDAVVAVTRNVASEMVKGVVVRIKTVVAGPALAIVQKSAKAGAARRIVVGQELHQDLGWDHAEEALGHHKRTTPHLVQKREMQELYFACS